MIHLTALGTLSLSNGDGSELSALLTQPKRFALFVYLSLPNPGTMHRRDTLLGMFWPALDQVRGRAALRTSLTHLRLVLGHEVVVRRGKDEVGISPESLHCDVTAFETAVEDGDWDTALGLYQGHLLEGVFPPNAIGFERWLENERARLRELAARAAWAQAHRSIDAGRPVDAARTAQRAVDLVATDESEVRRFVTALAASGDRASAVRFFEKFAERLRIEYELEPSPDTVTVADTIRANGLGAGDGNSHMAFARGAPVSSSGSHRLVEPPPGSVGFLRRWVVGGWTVTIARRQVARST